MKDTVAEDVEVAQGATVVEINQRIQILPLRQLLEMKMQQLMRIFTHCK